MVKVAIINTTFLNTGDAAINLGTMQILRELWGNATEFVCFDAQAEAAARLYPDLDIRRPAFERIAEGTPATGPLRKAALLATLATARLIGRRPRRAAWRLLRRTSEILRDYADADVVISAGGTYLVANYRMAPKIFELLVVIALGRPLVLFTQSVGPFRRNRERRLLGWCLRRARLILVRDDRSLRELSALGVPPRRVALCQDAAFALARPATRERPRGAGNPVRIAVSVRNWPFLDSGGNGMSRYLDAVAGFVQRVVEKHGAEVTFVSSCQGVPEYWTDDARTAEHAVARLPAHLRAGVRVDDSFRDPEELIGFLAGFDHVVATRMHVAILALCAGRPVVPISYEFKTRELFASLDRRVPVCSIETVTAGKLYANWECVARMDASVPGQELRLRVEGASHSAREASRAVACAVADGAAR